MYNEENNNVKENIKNNNEIKLEIKKKLTTSK